MPGLVLMYHRVTDLPLDPFSLAVSPTHFAEHMAVLRKYWHPTKLHHMVQMVSDRMLDRVIAVTFDDGYSDVFVNAKNSLEFFDIPATVFLVSRHIGSDREFMWDELERVLLWPGVLPSVLSLVVENRVLEWHLGDFAKYSDAVFSQHREWEFESETDPTTRHVVFRKIYYILKYAPPDVRRKILDDLREWSGSSCQPRDTHKPLTEEQVRRLSQEGLITIGAHTVSHPVLASISSTVQRQEIEQCKIELEEMLGQSITDFAFPYGGVNDYTPETIAILKQSGYKSACTTLEGNVKAGADLYQLPRLDVKDWNGEVFANRLALAIEE